MKEGDIAPWDGRLLNEPALRILIEENATSQMTCDARTQYEINKIKIEENFRYDVLKVQTDAEIKQLNKLVTIQEAFIKDLKPQNRIWPVVGGFVIGAGMSIAIMYAVKPGITQ
jgi:hypothetical protein